MPEPVRPPPSSIPVPPGTEGTSYGEPGLASPVRYGKVPGGPPARAGGAAHVVDDEEKAFKRNILAGLLAMAAGVCFILGGVNGAGMWQDILGWAAPSLGDFQGPMTQLLLVIASLAALGGILVIGGGMALLAQRLFLGQLMVFIGGGTGLAGLVLTLGIPLWQGAVLEFWKAILALVSLSGAGTILSIAAGLTTRLPFSLRKMLFGKR